MFKDEIVKIEIFKSMDREEHFHPDIELVYVIRGEVNITIENSKYVIKKEEFLLINKDNKHSLKTTQDAVLICFQVNYRELCKLTGKDSIIFQGGLITNENSNYIQLKESINALLECFFSKGNNLTVLNLQLNLVSKLVEYFIIASNKSVDDISNKKHLERVEDIRSYIFNNYKDPISLSNLAEKEFLTVPYLSKFIKEHFGMTFTEYLNSIRLSYAMEDIVYTDMPVTRIALDNGFATIFNFNKCFKETYQMTPNEYRKKFKQGSKLKNKIDKEAKEEIKNYLDSNKLENNDSELSKDQVIIKVDINNNETIQKHHNKVINIGYANDILQSLLQEHILMIRSEIKFEYARFWGIFNEDMNIEGKDNEYTFYNIDKILDFIISAGMKPFINLMPKAKKISKNVEEHVTLKAEVVKSRTLEEWEKLIRKFIIHCINRYGSEEVEKWYFEVTRIASSSSTLSNKNENLMFFEIFNVIYKNIKEILPNAKVGGPGGNFIKSSALEFFLEWKEAGCTPDFVSIYMYPYTTLIKNGGEGVQASSEKDYLVKKLYNIKEITKNAGYITDEVIISEWNSTVSNRNYTNDGCSKAAYIIKNVLDSINKIDALSYFMASDISGEYLDTDLLLQGGTGLISKNGMKKPSFYAFSFLEKLSVSMVQKGDNYIITKNSSNVITMVCHNYKHFNNSYLLNSEENINLHELENIYENENKLKLSFSMVNLKKGKYRVKSYILNEKYGSVLDKWIELKSDNNLRSDEISYLKGISIPKLDIEYIDFNGEELNYSLELLPHEVRLLTFEIDYK